MKNGFILFLIASFFSACSSDNAHDNALLQQPPYAALTDSIQMQENNAGLYYRRGQLLAQNQQTALAEADYRKAWRLQPNEDHAIGVASLLVKKNTDSAITFIQQALQKVPNSLVLQVSLARGFQQKEQYEKALSVVNQIIADYPNQLDALLLKAELLKATGRDKESLASLEQAYSYAPFDAELAHSLAFEYAQTNNPKALYLADSLIKSDSAQMHAEPYYFKGIYYANTGNAAQALRLFDEAIRHNYNFLDAYMDKGTLLYNRKQYKEAQKTFELATTVSPTFADAYYWLGKTVEAMGNKAEAKLNYQRAYGLDKSLTEAKEAAGRL